MLLGVVGSSSSLPPSAGQVLWLKADAGITKTGSSITAWADQSTNGNNFILTTGASPTLVASAINGLPAANFAIGFTQFLDCSALALSGARHLFIVRQLNPVPSSSPTFYCPLGLKFPSSTTNFSSVYYNKSGGSHPYTWQFDISTSGPSVGAAVTLDGSWHVDALSWDGVSNTATSSYTLSVDAAAQTVLTDGTEGVIAGIINSRLGADLTSTASSYFGGRIAEVLLYNRVLTGTEVSAVQGYLNSRYGIS